MTERVGSDSDPAGPTAATSASSSRTPRAVEPGEGGQHGEGPSAAGRSAGAEWETPHGGIPVAVDEPLLSARVHRPPDLIRFLGGLLGILAVFLLADVARNATTGIAIDLTSGATKLPSPVTTLAGVVPRAAVFVMPVAFAVERLIKRDVLRVADGVLAAALAYVLSLGVDWWVADAANETVRQALFHADRPVSGLTDPVRGSLAPLIAYMTAVHTVSRPRWRVALWVVVVFSCGTEIINGYSALSAALTVLLGWTISYGTRYALGSPNVRPTGRSLLVGLRRFGFRPVSAERAPDASDGTRRYYVVQRAGPPLDVRVIDREAQASGFFYRLWRQVRLRSIAIRPSPRSPSQALRREALIAYAAAASGARVPHLMAASELGPDAVLLVYEHVPGRSFDELDGEEITDEVLASLCGSVRALHRRRVAHCRLTGASLLVVDDRTGHLTNLSDGMIAAGDFTLRMDVAQLLTTFALRVGPERAVAAAARVLGRNAVAAALPLLQPIGLSRSTRAELRRCNRESDAGATGRATGTGTDGAPADATADGSGGNADLLARVRERALEMVPRTPIAPVRLERFQPKTLMLVVGGALAVYYLLTSFRPTQIDFAEMNWFWALAGLLAAAASYVPATMCLTGFVLERLSFRAALLAQVAGSFVKLVAPAAVGGVALNTRFLQKAGVRPVRAVASVGASQLAGLGCHLLLLFVAGYVSGTENRSALAPSRTVIAGVLTAAVLFLLVIAIPRLRRFVVSRLRPLLAPVLPRVLDLLQRPYKLLTGFGGYLLLTATFVVCLYASLRAFGDAPSLAVVSVIQLTATAVGSAVPTPGGIGAIEGALVGALVGIAGVPLEVATPAVLLYRLFVFWLPVFPGWLCFAYLQRKNAL